MAAPPRAEPPAGSANGSTRSPLEGERTGPAASDEVREFVDGGLAGPGPAFRDAAPDSASVDPAAPDLELPGDAAAEPVRVADPADAESALVAAAEVDPVRVAAPGDVESELVAPDAPDLGAADAPDDDPDDGSAIGGGSIGVTIGSPERVAPAPGSSSAAGSLRGGDAG